MRLLLIVGVIAAAAACAPAERMSEGCDARAASTWAAAGGDLHVEATTTGPDCARAVATLVIRDASGAPLYAEAHVATHVMVLADAGDRAAMQTALAEWVRSDNATYATTSALPDWPANAEGPVSGEFPFMPAEGTDRALYQELRQGNTPVFCYVQGMESLACVTLRNGGVEHIGLQLFPG